MLGDKEALHLITIINQTNKKNDHHSERNHPDGLTQSVYMAWLVYYGSHNMEAQSKEFKILFENLDER